MLPEHWELVKLASGSSKERLVHTVNAFQSMLRLSLLDFAAVETKAQAHEELYT